MTISREEPKQVEGEHQEKEPAFWARDCKYTGELALTAKVTWAGFWGTKQTPLKARWPQHWTVVNGLSQPVWEMERLGQLHRRLWTLTQRLILGNRVKADVPWSSQSHGRPAQPSHPGPWARSFSVGGRGWSRHGPEGKKSISHPVFSQVWDPSSIPGKGGKDSVMQAKAVEVVMFQSQGFSKEFWREQSLQSTVDGRISFLFRFCMLAKHICTKLWASRSETRVLGVVRLRTSAYPLWNCRVQPRL